MGENLEGKTNAMYKTVSLNDKKIKYSPIEINSYDKERHIPQSYAYGLINQANLDETKLNEAVANGEIEIYSFKGEN